MKTEEVQGIFIRQAVKVHQRETEEAGGGAD